MKKFSRFTLLSLAIALLLIPSFGFAQTSSTTGAITGTVSDTSGAVLPGVTVTVTSPQLQGSRTATTDANRTPTTTSGPITASHAGVATRRPILVAGQSSLAVSGISSRGGQPGGARSRA